MTTETTILDRPLYGYAEVDRILDLPTGTARRWVDGYSRQGRQYEPVIRTEPLGVDADVTWGEFIETYYLARLRSHDRPIPMPRIRRAVQRLRKETGLNYVFAHEQVIHADRQLLQLIREIQDEEDVDDLLVEVIGTGQLILIPDARHRLERIEFDRGVAVSVPPRLDIDLVVVAGDTNFGRPTIKGTNITPSAVAELVQAGDPPSLVESAYDITPAQLTDAGRFTYGDQWRLAA